MGLESPNILKWAEQWEPQRGHLPIARNWEFRHCKVGPKPLDLTLSFFQVLPSSLFVTTLLVGSQLIASLYENQPALGCPLLSGPVPCP